MGQTLSNHSYVDLTLVGNERLDGGHSVQCHTDLSTCCSATEGPHRGDWYFPNGDRLPFPDGSDILESRNYQRVDLHRNDGTGPAGIYRCDIPTNAVNDNGLRETVYVGLYAGGGNRSQLQVPYIRLYMFIYTLPCPHSLLHALLAVILLTVLFCVGDVSIGDIKFLVVSDLNGPLLSSSSPVSPLVDLLPLSLGPETPLPLSLKGLRLC